MMPASAARLAVSAAASCALAVAHALASSACGSAPPPVAAADTEAAPAASAAASVAAADTPAPWVEVDVKAVRMGGSVRFDITGIGRNHREGEALEDPEHWQVSASCDDGKPLQRLVNGSTHVEREPVGPVRHNLWDVMVRFSIAFTLPEDAASVAIVVTPPGAEATTVTIGELLQAERTNSEQSKRSAKPAKPTQNRKQKSKRGTR